MKKTFAEGFDKSFYGCVVIRITLGQTFYLAAPSLHRSQ